MQINFQGKNMEVTGAVHDYVLKRITNLGKLLTGIEKKGGEVLVHFEVAKTTNHHKSGNIFRADCSIVIDGKKFYSSSDKPDLYEAIDDCKDQLFREIKKKKDRRWDLVKSGAQKLKKMMQSAQFWK